MIRLYVDASLSENQQVGLNENQSHYVQKVMRLKYDDIIFLFNGKDGEWQARITHTGKKTTEVSLVSQQRLQSDKGNLCLLFSPLKPKRQEFLVEKATELGVSCLWPIRCERTSIPKVNLEKMRAQAVEAAEQCGRLDVPEIKDLTPLAHLLNNWAQEGMLLFGDETMTSPSLATITREPDQFYGFFVGPEGGFTLSERTLLKSHSRTCGVTLNPHILRAETAALVGISCLQLIKI
ncbi:MAG: 16S rRNA (uracil(1498)-N(3))-methyltransferase [Alphaproteobacteria bacterium]|nr:16S rRNA (uracil(1498)-N(3))-methyltransferase [Alphaproteobacteria bacterium]